MLNTPYFKLISNIPDGSNELKEQITRSVSRMKAARHGHSIDRIFQDHDYTFYLPQKTSYMSRRKAKLMRLESETSSTTYNLREKSKIFKTEVPDDQYSSNVHVNSTKLSTRAHTTTRTMHKRHNTSYDQSLRFREMKEKYTTEMQSLPTENNTISFIVKENNSNSQETHNSINNILEYKPTRPTIDDEEVRMVSYIDSKPLQPYISLLPLKNFLKKEQEFSRKGTLGKTNDSSSQSHTKGKASSQENNIDTGHINWANLLSEELSEMIKKQEEVMSSYRKKLNKENTEKDSEKRLTSVYKANAQHQSLIKKRGIITGQALFNPSARHMSIMRQSKGREGPNINIQNMNRTNKTKSLERQYNSSNNVEWDNTVSGDPRLDMLIKATRLEDLTFEDRDELRKIFPQEIMEILEFHDYKKVIVEHLQDPDFQKLLRSRFRAHEDARKARIALSNRSDRGNGDETHFSNKAPEEMNKNELEELEEIKKKEKMKLDQELIEFNRKGGFAKVLHDLFYNPDIGSLEFDSVYKLKQL